MIIKSKALHDYLLQYYQCKNKNYYENLITYNFMLDNTVLISLNISLVKDVILFCSDTEI